MDLQVLTSWRGGKQNQNGGIDSQQAEAIDKNAAKLAGFETKKEAAQKAKAETFRTPYLSNIGAALAADNALQKATNTKGLAHWVPFGQRSHRLSAPS